MTKTRKLYSVRYFGRKGSCYSVAVGHKMRLVDRTKALRLVRRLKAAGVDAVAAPSSSRRKARHPTNGP